MGYLVNCHRNSDAGTWLEDDSYDAWGKRRNLNGVVGTINSVTVHGYTNQEQLYNAQVIDLNARMYDPFLAKMLSVDPVISNNLDLQSYNPYAYAGNNPLAFTDPTGMCKGLFGCIGSFFMSPFKLIMPVIQHNPIIGDMFVIVGSIVGGPEVGAALEAEITGYETGNIWKGLEAGAIVYGEAEVMYKVGTLTGGGGVTCCAADYFENAVGHGVVGGVVSIVQGGDFQSGFLAAGVGGLVDPYALAVDHGLGGTEGLYAGTAISAVSGGVGSVLGGGKFANGAETGAFGYLFNAAMHDAAAALKQTQEQYGNVNVKAFLGAIADAEGGGYNTMIGGSSFSDMSTHPTYVPCGDNMCSAAGEYQETIRFWQQYGGEIGLNDFSPNTQDLLATRALNDAGAIQMIEVGNIAGAVNRANGIWSSLPGGSQQQVGIDMFKANYQSHLSN
jgi:RHS repeat-associated protein